MLQYWPHALAVVGIWIVIAVLEKAGVRAP